MARFCLKKPSASLQFAIGLCKLQEAKSWLWPEKPGVLPIAIAMPR
jgi:hypothetical protein